MKEDEIKNKLNSMRGKIIAIYQIVLDFEKLNDVVNKQQAMQITGVTSNTFNNYVSRGKYIVVCRNKAGQPFFSCKQ